MTRTRARPRHQHHVPRLLQKAWATPGSGKARFVYVLDKHDDRTFRTSIDNILGERDFNTFEQDGVVFCMEDGIGKIESDAAGAIDHLRAHRTLAGLSVEATAALAVFAALQRLRGVGLRNQLLDLDAQIRARLRAGGDDPDLVPQLQGSDDPEQVKLTAMMLIRDHLGVFSRSLAGKAMFLMAAPKGHSFLLGDNPAVMANSTDTGPYGNIGFEVEGIEFYLPLAPDLALGFWCPTLPTFLETALRQGEASLKTTAAAALFGVGPEVEDLRQIRRDLIEWAVRIREDLANLAAGTPLNYSPENMDYINSLQIGHAERHVLSASGDFSLARRMISDNPTVRGGVRSRVE